MRHALYILLVLLAVVLDMSFRAFGIGPDFTVILAYYAGLKYGHNRGLATGLVIGALCDMMTGAYLGPNMLAKGTAGYVAAYIRGGMFMWTPLLGLLGISVLTAMDGLISYSSVAMFFGTPTTFGNAMIAIIIQAIINSPAGLLIKPTEQQH